MPNPLDEFYTVKITSCNEIKSPCVRNCCLDNEDVCLGCNRTLEEILTWGSASCELKQEIINNAARRAKKDEQLVATAF